MLVDLHANSIRQPSSRYFIFPSTPSVSSPFSSVRRKCVWKSKAYFPVLRCVCVCVCPVARSRTARPIPEEKRPLLACLTPSLSRLPLFHRGSTYSLNNYIHSIPFHLLFQLPIHIHPSNPRVCQPNTQLPLCTRSLDYYNRHHPTLCLAQTVTILFPK